MLRIKTLSNNINSNCIITELDDNGTYVLTLNQPHNLNILSKVLIAELSKIFISANNNNFVKVLLIKSNHPKYFCAGADIKEIAKFTKSDVISKNFFEDIKLAFETLKKPIICCLEGSAFGGGLEIALQCDIIIANKDITIAFPEINLGLFPCILGTVISKRIGLYKANEIILTGRKINYLEFKEWGIFNYITDTKEECFNKAIAICSELCLKNNDALILAKNAIKSSYFSNYTTAKDHEQNLFNLLIGREDTSKLLNKFLKK